MWWKRIQLHTPFWVTLVFIVGLALFTRLYDLGKAPAGITWDEAALGYVGKMVVRTTRDEYLHRFPVTFQSFGDYKSPLSFYVAGVSTTLFGLNAWATRLPFALAGVASICLMIWLSWRIFGKPWYALLSGFLLTVLPWHLLFSRVTFESGLNLFWFLLLLVGWMEAHLANKEQTQRSRLGFLLFVTGSVASLYTYHAAKIVTPLTLLLIIAYETLYHRETLKQKRNEIAVSVFGMLILGAPFAWDMISGPGTKRGLAVSFIRSLPPTQVVEKIFTNILVHLDLDFLLWGSTTTLRHNTPDYGVFFIGHLLLFWLGITFVIGRMIQRWRAPQQPTLWSKITRYFHLQSIYQQPHIRGWFWLVLLVIGLLPAAIGTEIPHANRALLAIVPAILLMTLGARELQEELKPQAFASILGTIVLLIMLQFSTFWNYYLTDYQRAASEDWLEGQEQAVKLAQQYQQEGKHIKFSSGYGQPLTFYAFYNQIPYEMYRQFSVPGIDFGRVHLEDWNVYDVIITTPYDDLPFAPDMTIYRQDDKASFYVYEVE